MVSITPSCQPHHRVVGKRKSPGPCEFTGENTLGRETLCFYRYGGSWGRRRRVCVSAAIWESGRQKAHRTVARV